MHDLNDIENIENLAGNRGKDPLRGFETAAGTDAAERVDGHRRTVQFGDVASDSPDLDPEIERLRELVRTLEARLVPRLTHGCTRLTGPIELPLRTPHAHARPSSESPADPDARLRLAIQPHPPKPAAVEALVVQAKDKSCRPIPSKKRAQSERAWGAIEKIKEDDGVIAGTVIEVVKGGLLLNVGRRGFLPASEIEIRKASPLEEYVGRRLTAKILELDHHRRAVVLSRKAWLKENPIEQRRPIVAFIFAHWPNQIAAGRVTKLIPSGAFVCLGVGVEGWVPLSELAGRYFEAPKQIVKVGDEVFLKILDMDPDKGRISLSLKQANDPVLVQEFDPALYGMTVKFDEQGNYEYPEGFDAVTKEWREGHEDQREEWEEQYTDAHTKWEAHKAQVDRAAIDDAASPSKAKSAGKKAHRAPTRQQRARRSRLGESDHGQVRSPTVSGP
jgi:predicted RNA-binding protein with RPS1 domain